MAQSGEAVLTKTRYENIRNYGVSPTNRMATKPRKNAVKDKQLTKTTHPYSAHLIDKKQRQVSKRRGRGKSGFCELGRGRGRPRQVPFNRIGTSSGFENYAPNEFEPSLHGNDYYEDPINLEDTFEYCAPDSACFPLFNTNSTPVQFPDVTINMATAYGDITLTTQNGHRKW